MEQQPIVEIPPIVGIGPVVVEPRPAIVIAFDVERARVAVGVRYVRGAICATAHRIFSGLYRIWHL